MHPSDPRDAIGPWLRLLWNVTPPLVRAQRTGEDGDPLAPWLSHAGLHLPDPPAGPDEDGAARWLRAASAHSAAHLVFSRSVFVREGVPAVTWALTGLLEDARAEALAARELPGLARLWSAQHSATPASGDGFESLLARLARALGDAAYDDPHPWVRKGRALFWRDAAQQVLAVPDAPSMRALASRLGHDIGQMRMGLNTRTYRPAPSYRDDNRWLWHAEGIQAAKPLPAPARASPRRSEKDVQYPTAESQWRYPEWDARAAIWRRDWCTVFETIAPADGLPQEACWPAPPAQVAHSLARATRGAGSRLPSAEPGDELHLDGVVRLAAARRRRVQEPAARPYLRKAPAPGRAAALLLVDTSASSGAASPKGGPGAMSRQCAQASALAQAMQAAGWRVAIHGFHSDGRHRVQVQRVLDFDEPWGASAGARLASLRPGFSTRLGTVVRHATRILTAQPAQMRWTLVIGDGEPHDIDVHDGYHLVADARAAVMAARRAGLSVICLHPGPMPVGRAAVDVFGLANMTSIEEVSAASIGRALMR